MLPPYDTRDTLTRLERDLKQTQARHVICLGDSFDDMAAAAQLPEAERIWLISLQAGRRWVWIEGNHDPARLIWVAHIWPNWHWKAWSFAILPKQAHRVKSLGTTTPKKRLTLKGRSLSRPAFLIDKSRAILPAYGTYTVACAVMKRCWPI